MYLIEFLQETNDRFLQMVITGALVLTFFVTRNLTARIIKRFGRRKGLSLARVKYTIKYFNFVFFVIFLLFMGLTWDISFQGLSVYFLSFFTVAGIGLFAAWSILSNITAAIILFFYFPYKIGSKIRIVDGDNTIEGLVYDLNLFSILIKNSEGQVITYPNNLALQKAIVIISDPK